MSYSERLNDISIVRLNTDGFSGLTEKQKNLAFHLSEAGLWGKVISLMQCSKHNVELLESLISIKNKLPADSVVYQQVKDTLFTFFAHGGIYHTMSGERLDFPLEVALLENNEYVTPEEYLTISMCLESKDIPHYRTVQKQGVDVVKESGSNFYQGLNTEEVESFRKSSYPKHYNEEIPPYGFNEIIVKDESGEITRQVICATGIFSKYVKEIIKSLQSALEFTENEQQHKSISSLIKVYETGSAEDFDKHCIEWVKDQESSIYFINGLIESYKDPLGVGCNFESIVAFKNPEQTAKVQRIIDNIQWFENNLPFDKRFKKDKAVGLSASSINVVSMAGDTSPVLPLGVNLPNSDWIRKQHGSKSVTLANVDSSRSTHDEPLTKALYLAKYVELIKKYGSQTGVLHTDLHEIAGHGSGKVLDGVSTESLSTYYSVIEECRADLVALYYVADEKLKEIGIFAEDVNVEDAALSKYVSYITNGAISQLRRVKLGNDLTQAHFRNRQLISTWLLEKADKDKLSMVTHEGSFYIEVNDVKYVRELIGKLLAEIQRIKSEGDFEGAKYLVETYGTEVNEIVHREVLERISSLNLATVVGFITPLLVKGESGVEIVQETDFLEHQLNLYKKYS